MKIFKQCCVCHQQQQQKDEAAEYGLKGCEWRLGRLQRERKRNICGHRPSPPVKRDANICKV